MSLAQHVGDETPKAREKRRVSGTTKRRRDGVKMIRWAIWCYIVLWLIEGGLRRWVLPELTTPLLAVRDPVAIGIYAMAIKFRVWPKNVFMIAVFVLAPLSWIFGIAAHGNVLVATYGVRCDFLHVPLIFIMAKVLTHRDVDRLCRVALWIAIPYTLLLMAQFYSPQSAWVNRGLGGDVAGAGFSGALGKFRPPGTFSFITGPAALYPMMLGGWFYLLCRKKLPTFLMLASGVAIVMAIPFSVSRGLFIGELLVGGAGMMACLMAGIFSTATLARLSFAVMVVAGVAYYYSDNTDSFDAFLARWQNSTTNRGGAEVAILGRVIDDLARSVRNVPAIGYGTGISTQVGQKVAMGTRGFGHSEGEWGRILADGGMLLGPLILGFRLLLFGSLVQKTVSCIQRRRFWMLGFAPTASTMVLLGQWGHTTSLGAAVITLGLCFAAAKADDLKSAKRPRSPHARVKTKVSPEPFLEIDPVPAISNKLIIK